MIELLSTIPAENAESSHLTVAKSFLNMHL